MVGDQKVLSFVLYRAQILYEKVSESLLGLTDVEEATSGATDTVDQVGGCTGEPLSDVKGLLWALNGGEGGGVGAGAKLRPLKEEDIWDVQEWNAPSWVEAEQLVVRDHILAGGWVRGSIVQVVVGVSGFEIDVSFKVVRDGKVQEGDRGIGDGPGEFEAGE
eukprot:g46538.t1